MNQISPNLKIKYKQTGIALLIGSILSSFILYIIVMLSFGKNGNMYTGVYFWSEYIKEFNHSVGGYSDFTRVVDSKLTGIAICFIVLAILLLATILTGFFIHKKINIKTTKFVSVSCVSAFVIFTIALVLSLLGKIHYIEGEEGGNVNYPHNVSIWLTYDYRYRPQTIVVIVLLSLSIVFPIVYSTIGLVKFYKYNN